MNLLEEPDVFRLLFTALRTNNMKICGIIAEYNPFHNGHEYHIGKAKELTGCDFVVVCMSGDYVQRGLPAVTDKYNRTEAALKGGADLIIELPTVYAVSSAENFAMGAVTILDKVGCDYLCFGSELNNTQILYKAADAFDEIEKNHSDMLARYQKNGLSYAKSMERVMTEAGKEFPSLLSNDKLGIAYIRAMRKIGSRMNVVTVGRMGGDYLSKDKSALSAMAVRELLKGNSDKSSVGELVPEYSLPHLIDESCDFRKTVMPDDFSDLLYMKIMDIKDGSVDAKEFRNKLATYVDVSDNIAGRIVNNINGYSGFSDFAEKVHTPEYTMSRVYRAFMHILLDITINDMNDFMKFGAAYVRILGFNIKSREMLSFIKKNSDIKIISKLADAERILDENELNMLKKDIMAADIYEYIESRIQSRERISEFRRNIVNCM